MRGSNWNNSGLLLCLNYLNCEYTVIILSAQILRFFDSKAEKAERRRSKIMYFVLFCSAEFLSWGEAWKAPLSCATLDALFWSSSAFVHITDCQSLALQRFTPADFGPRCQQPKCTNTNQMWAHAKQKKNSSLAVLSSLRTCEIIICLFDIRAAGVPTLRLYIHTPLITLWLIWCHVVVFDSGLNPDLEASLPLRNLSALNICCQINSNFN